MNIVHVVGTGTIGEPLIGLLADNKSHFGIDEVTFHKRTPLVTEKAKVEDLVRRGAVLVVDENRKATFEELGHTPKYETLEAIERATVVIDCTPVGNEMKEEFYKDATGPIGFMAQGSEYGFGKMYARGINDDALVANEDKFLQIVSCNTHNIAVLIKSLAMDNDGTQPPRRRSLPLHASGQRHLPGQRFHRQPGRGWARGRPVRDPPRP